ncbi:MAG: hypothetical protein QF733_09245 [Phycisphaerales bacterium]|jgi:phospholipase/carboxylesterase|nr:hypothetical protein [Phycisphaerales bacterium]
MTTEPALRTVVLPPSSDTPPADRGLVLLHGYGANAADLLPLRDALAPNWTAVALEAPIDLGPMGMPGGRAWFHISPDPGGGIAYDTEGAEAAIAMLEREIPKTLEASGLAPERAVVLGFSQGAMLGHGLLLHQRVPIGGLAACSGRMIPEVFTDEATTPEQFPVFLSHGTLDELIPVASGHAIRAFYERDTPAEVTWCEEAVGHGIGPDTAAALRGWMQTR